VSSAASLACDGVFRWATNKNTRPQKLPQDEESIDSELARWWTDPSAQFHANLIGNWEPVAAQHTILKKKKK
jgi:hypothetical protein